MADETRDTLEQKVREAPADPVPRLVLGDWLQQHGDPAGPLVTLQHGPDKVSADRYVRTHRAALLGELSLAKLGWFCGFLQSVRLAEELPFERKLEALRALPALTVGRFIEELHLAFDPADDPVPAVAALEAFSSLRVLAIAGPSIGAFDVTLPKLTSLKLQSTKTAPPLRRLLERAPGLTALAVDRCTFSDELCEAIAKLPHAKKLTSLALTNGDMTITGARALAAAHLRLQSLDVTGNRLEAPAKAVLMRLCTGVKFGEQDVEGEVVREGRPEGWVVLDKPKVDLDLAVRSAAMLGKHHALRELALESSEGVAFGAEPQATVLRLLGLGGALKLDGFAESLARRAESLRRADKFRVLCLHLSPTTAAYRLFDATGELGHAAGADADVIAEGLTKLLGAPPSGHFLDWLRTRGTVKTLMADYQPAKADAPVEGFTPFTVMDISFDVEDRRADGEGFGRCADCGGEGEVYECEGCNDEFCGECLREPEDSTALVCRDCEREDPRYTSVSE